MYHSCIIFTTEITILEKKNGNPYTGKQNLNTLRPRQKGPHFPHKIFKCIFLNENVWISIKIPVKFVPKGSINNIQALFQIMAWHRPGDKPLSETMVVTLLMHICTTLPQWVNTVTWPDPNELNSMGVFISVKLQVQYIAYNINTQLVRCILVFNLLHVSQKATVIRRAGLGDQHIGSLHQK